MKHTWISSPILPYTFFFFFWLLAFACDDMVFDSNLSNLKLFICGICFCDELMNNTGLGICMIFIDKDIGFAS